MEKKTWKEQQLQQREAEILKVARRMFAQQGFRETNLNDVAKEVGIARGTIYLHFPTKEDLFKAIVDQGEEQLLASMRQAIDDISQPKDQLKAVLVAYLRIYREYEDLIQILSPELHGLVAARVHGPNGVSAIPVFVQEIIEAGKQAEQFSLDIDTKLAAYALLSIVTMPTYYDLVGSGAMSHEDLVNSAVQLYFGGLGR